MIGLGYIGLPTAVLFAMKGFQVFGFDINESIVENINNCKSHINEKDLDLSLKEVVRNNYLIAKTNPSEADVYIIAVPTPHYLKNNGMYYPDISMIIDAINSIAPLLKKDDLIILESTSPVGTTEKIYKLILENTELNADQIDIAYCPERVLPGNIFSELRKNDRVIGGINRESSEKAKELYSYICEGQFFVTNPNTAEMVKLSENAFRDVNIAFANELSMICDELDINVWELIHLANRHPRVNILEPGPGVGGHCIAVDPWFLISQNINESNLLITSRKVNYLKTNWVVNKIQEKGELLQKEIGRLPNIGLMGMTFKANVGDIRNSPALEIVKAASATGVHALKLQTYTADTITLDVKQDSFFIQDDNSLWKGKSLYELYQEAHTPWGMA